MNLNFFLNSNTFGHICEKLRADILKINLTFDKPDFVVVWWSLVFSDESEVILWFNTTILFDKILFIFFSPILLLICKYNNLDTNNFNNINAIINSPIVKIVKLNVKLFITIFFVLITLWLLVKSKNIGINVINVKKINRIVDNVINIFLDTTYIVFENIWSSLLFVYV